MKIKSCIYCGKELTADDPLNGKKCTACAFARLRRWLELVKEAKAKFDEEWKR